MCKCAFVPSHALAVVIAETGKAGGIFMKELLGATKSLSSTQLAVHGSRGQRWGRVTDHGPNVYVLLDGVPP